MSEFLDFIKDFKKDVSKVAAIEESAPPPRWWTSAGNFVINKIMSGSYSGCYAQGRLTSLSGPSGAGKSYLACNAIREFQQSGGDYVVVLDSENALDDDFTSKIGVNTKEGYAYIPVESISQTSAVVSKFIKNYKSQYGEDLANAPKIMMVIDSLDMLMTETELENFSKGEFKGDQGQRSKQLKAMLRSFVQAVKHTNITMIVTNQVYRNQDLKNGLGTFIINEAVQYSLSQILLLTKLKLKDTGATVVNGIRMKIESYKTRFAKPYQTVTIEVPYDTGMDPYNGLLEVGVATGIVEKVGNSRFRMKGAEGSWFARDLANYAEDILVKVKTLDFIVPVDDDEEDMPPESTTETKRKRKNKATEEATD